VGAGVFVGAGDGVNVPVGKAVALSVAEGGSGVDVAAATEATVGDGRLGCGAEV